MIKSTILTDRNYVFNNIAQSNWGDFTLGRIFALR